MQQLFRRTHLRHHLAALRLCLYFGLACFLVLATGLQARTEQDAGWELAGSQPLDAFAAQLPFLGITVALEQYAPTARRAALATLQQSGFGWVRQRLDWGQLEPAPGHYDWQLSDALLHDMTASGLIPVLVLDGSPAWARAAENRAPTANSLAPPADPATFARFAAAVATRYGDHLRFYQLWDEPNIAPHWGNRLIEPFAYAQLLKAATPAIRAADRDAIIITAALAPTRDRGHLAIDEVYFLQRLYAAGAAPFFDIVATQPFGFGSTPDDIRARPERLNFQRVKLIRRAMLAAGDGAKPIWAVRYGWNTSPNSPWQTVRPADQVAFATDALTLARQQWPWITAMGWAIDQPAQPHSDPTWGFALTPALSDAFSAWQRDAVNPHGEMTAEPASHPDYWRWTILVLGWLLLSWRVVAAVHLLPWRVWGQAYASQSGLRQSVGWLVLLLIYYFATWPPLIALCWIAAVFLISSNPLVGLALVALFLPFYFQHKEVELVNALVTVPPAHVMLLCLWLALLATKRAIASYKIRPMWHEIGQRGHMLDWLALAWVGLSLLTSINVWQWPAYGQGLLDLVLLPSLAYAAVRVLINTPTRQTRLITALFLGGLGAALIGLVMWSQGKGTMADGVLRLVGPYFSPNHTALYLERTFWLGLGLALSMRSAWRRWLLLATGIVGMALGLTASRGAWILGMPVGLLLFIWSAGIRQWDHRVVATRWAGRSAMLSVVVAAGIFLGMGSAPLQPLWDRFTNSTTISERLITWQATHQLWQDHWLMGVGPGGFFWHYPNYLPWQAQSDPNLLHPHNLWLELLAGWGALALLWFIGIVWQMGLMLSTLRDRAQTQPRWQQIGLLAALAAGIAHGQVDTFAALPDIALWNWLAWGLLVNSLRK